MSTSLAAYRTVVNVETATFGTVAPHRMQRAVCDDRPARGSLPWTTGTSYCRCPWYIFAPPRRYIFTPPLTVN